MMSQAVISKFTVARMDIEVQHATELVSHSAAEQREIARAAASTYLLHDRGADNVIAEEMAKVIAEAVHEEFGTATLVKVYDRDSEAGVLVVINPDVPEEVGEPIDAKGQPVIDVEEWAKRFIDSMRGEPT